MNLWFNPILWEYKFLRPDLLWLLIPVWLIYLWMIIPKRRNNTFAVLTTTAYIDKETSEQFLLFKKLNWIGYFLAATLLVVAISGPVQSDFDGRLTKKNIEGIDIVLALDISASMQENDLKPNRLVAAQGVAAKFIEARKNDRIGVVIYEGESFLMCPLTTDRKLVQNRIKNIQSGILAEGTSIGRGLNTSLNALLHSNAKVKLLFY